MIKHITYYIVVLVFFLSCAPKQDNGDAIARVADTYLYRSDLEKLLPTNFTTQDSILLVKNYINNWAKDQLLIRKAEINLDDDKEVEDLVNQYRQDILIDKYKGAAVSQYLDTVVTDDDVSIFYTENREIFQLNEELVKFKYIHFGNDLLNPEDFISLFKSNKKQDLDSLVSQEMQLKSFNFNDSTWIRLEDVLNKVPVLDESDKSVFLKKTRFFKKEDSLGVYLVAVKDVLRRNQTAPKSYVLPTIKQMILHKRKLELLKKIEQTLMEDAINNKEFEIFEMTQKAE